MKKGFIFILSLLLILTGCANNSSQQDEEKKLTIWAWDDSFNVHAANKAKEYYEGDYEVEVVSMSQDDIVQKLNTSLSSNSVEGLPNIVLVEDYKIQGYLRSYPEAFAKLDEIIDESKFSDYKLAVTKNDGVNYGVPFDSGVVSLFYRSDIFEEAGFTADDMQNITWEEYLEMGKVVHEKTGKYLLSWDPSELGHIRIMLQSAGSWFVDEKENVTLENNKALKNAVEIYKAFIDSGVVKTHSTWDEFVGGFNSGEIASVTTGSWIASSVKRGKDQDGKWAIAPAPRMGSNEDSVNRSSNGGSSWYVINDVAGKEEAVKFLGETFASNLSLMNDLAEEISLVATLIDAKDQSNYQKEDPFFGNQKALALFSEWTAEIPGVNYGFNTYLIEEILASHLLEYTNGSKDVDQLLHDAQVEAESAVQR